MDNIEILRMLPQLGVTSVVLLVLWFVNKDRTAKDQIDREERALTRKEFLDQLRSIEANHREEERADREQSKSLFDRVIAICGELSKAVSALDNGVRGLSAATQANEKAICDLREEMTKLRHMGDWRDDEKGKEPRRPRPAPQDRPGV